jgi:16S rRNA C967 or C1407 C5-methylase (RsmB/RsmF family)/NOL1/NOP2/fmu family ribosome biogenesis protein
MNNFPAELLKSLKHFSGFNELDFLNAHLPENKITSVRINPFKPAELSFPLDDKVAWSNNSFYLNERPAFTLDPLFHAGCYYVQEAGSIFLEEIFKQVIDLNLPLKVLDACAAPGGKSTLINSLINDESLLVSNELIKSRADALVHNLSKWGTDNSVVTNNDTEKFKSLKNYFDVIVVDAPCSGSGLFRKQPEAIDEWSVENVITCSVRQKNILNDLIPALKKGGFLIYSTCSFSEEENEMVVKNVIEKYNLKEIKINVSPDWGIVESEHGYRFYPHLTKSEGFYCAILQKLDDEEAERFNQKMQMGQLGLPNKNELNLLYEFANVPKNAYIKVNNNFHLINDTALQFMGSFNKHFYFKKAGVCIGEIKGKDVIPNQESAWYNHTNKNIETLELSTEKAIQYLRKQTFELDEKSKGLKLITYKCYGIGWAKVLINRMNNYLPNHYRIIN